MSEAYLEGMKTWLETIPRFLKPESEAYLEGMKTNRKSLELLIGESGPKPTSKEWKRSIWIENALQMYMSEAYLEGMKTFWTKKTARLYL